ncbi:MAG: c-type cytochrome [Acidobacteria bacterium]|nr:c-type cytochrome [Acidobacteriota bacterium]
MEKSKVAANYYQELLKKQGLIKSYYIFLSYLCLGLLLVSCTDKIEATLPPSPAPTPQAANEIPMHLKNIFLARCASCHGSDGKSGETGTIYQARSRSPKNWAMFLKNPQSVDKKSKKQPVKDLTEAEYAAFGEWLARITKENRLDLGSK